MAISIIACRATLRLFVSSRTQEQQLSAETSKWDAADIVKVENWASFCVTDIQKTSYSAQRGDQLLGMAPATLSGLMSSLSQSTRSPADMEAAIKTIGDIAKDSRIVMG